MQEVPKKTHIGYCSCIMERSEDTYCILLMTKCHIVECMQTLLSISTFVQFSITIESV